MDNCIHRLFSPSDYSSTRDNKGVQDHNSVDFQCLLVDLLHLKSLQNRGKYEDLSNHTEYMLP